MEQEIHQEVQHQVDGFCGDGVRQDVEDRRLRIASRYEQDQGWRFSLPGGGC